MASFKFLQFVLFLGAFGYLHIALAEYETPCDHPIFCSGPLLQMVQLSGMDNDTKTFVDRPLKYTIQQTMRNFNEFMDYHKNSTPPVEDVRTFVEYNFEQAGTEFDIWPPPDWQPLPSFLNRIADPNLRTFAFELNEIWKKLGRKIRSEIENKTDKYTMMYVPHGVIVPGGRFREFFYWDSYWIQKGLLRCEMYDTVQGMIRNFVFMVEKLGYVPNGGRTYFRRSQPPLLIPMVKNYLDATNNVGFVQEILPSLVKEFAFWDRNRSINVAHNGSTYRMFRYNLERNGPRPEGYRTEYILTEGMLEQEKNEVHSEIHSACESGIDFSSRWFVKPAAKADDLIYTKTRSFIPADLNGYLYYSAKLLAEFHYLIGDGSTGDYYSRIAEELKTAINAVLWDDDRGCWFDYNHESHERNTQFYPSNIVPLWAGAQESDNVINKVMSYLDVTGALNYPGGTPSSLYESGEQWDFPNAWAPFEDLIVEALDKSRNPAAQEKAFEVAKKWVWTNYIAYYNTMLNGTIQHSMYEKYDVTELGKPGGGGRYELVLGFGWSNGVIIDFLNKYGERDEMVAPTLL